jgi:hypothetical protein
MKARGRRVHVVDTNVPIVANRRQNESYSCASNCAQALLGIRNSGALIIDDGDLVLSEYRRHCSMGGQPGVGDSFVRWAHDHLGRSNLVERVHLTPSGVDCNDFEEFPDTTSLRGFDPSDRKFIALANAHPKNPVVLQASDSKWWGFREPLRECGITVDFLCPQEIAEAHARRAGRGSRMGGVRRTNH